MWILIALVAAAGYVFVKAFMVEARRTSWTLLEGLLAANILGHVLAFPLSWSIRDNSSPTQIVAIGLLALLACACMAGGAIWAMRRLKAINEQRGGRRMMYMLMGLFLFPSMLVIPFNFVFGWVIWLPLKNLNDRAEIYRYEEELISAASSSPKSKNVSANRLSA